MKPCTADHPGVVLCVVDVWWLCEDGSRARLEMAEVTAVWAWTATVPGGHGWTARQTAQQPRETNSEVYEHRTWDHRFVSPTLPHVCTRTTWRNRFRTLWMEPFHSLSLIPRVCITHLTTRVYTHYLVRLCSVLNFWALNANSSKMIKDTNFKLGINVK